MYLPTVGDHKGRPYPIPNVWGGYQEVGINRKLTTTAFLTDTSFAI